MKQQTIDEAIGNFESELYEFRRRYSDGLPADLAEALQEYKTLKQEHATLVIAGEDVEAKKLIPKILKVKGQAELAREWISTEGSAQSIGDQLKENPDCTAFKSAQKLLKAAEKKHHELIEAIKTRAGELEQKKNETEKLLTESGDLFRELFDLFAKIRKTLEPLGWSLDYPPKPPDPWALVLSDEQAAQAFGRKPFLI